jgi:murein DD-endopeptidase MepM/ murein hydrolase activator NlpD
MDKRKRTKSILAGILALALVIGLAVGFLPATAQAATSGELKAQLNALQQQNSNLQAEIRNLRSKLSENTDEIQRMVEEKNIIDQEIFLLYQQIDNINNQIATYSMLIADKQDELTAAQDKFDQLLAQNKERIQAMEEEGEVTYWSVLFQANSFADLLDRLNMVREIAAADKRRLEQLNAAAKEVSEAKAVLEEEKLALEETKKTLDTTQEELEVKRAEADALLVELVDRGMEYEAMVAMSEQTQAQLMLEIANKKDEYDNAVYREWLATSVPPTTKPKPPSQTTPPETTPTKPTEPGETTEPTQETTEPEETTKPTEETKPQETKPAEESWALPIYYTAFTSAFGYRTDPVYGGSAYHYGVDLAAPTGTPIYASRSGTVSTATYDGSCGYYVQINHGDGYRSIYMHMTHYVVSAGQYVSRGQVIGYCGSTGKSTGPHLHFGISYNGSYVNPANYIPI